MTAIIFKFQHPDGEPVVNAPFTVTLRKPNFDENTEDGILLPGDVTGLTDALGKCTLELASGYGVYYLTMNLDATGETSEGCMPGLRYKFVVPESSMPLRVETLIVTAPTWSRPWDEVALATIIEAKGVSVVAAEQARADALHVDQVAAIVDQDAVRAAASAESAGNSAAVATSKAAEAAASATNTAAMLGTKVDKVAGKGLSTNDYDAAEKAKVAAAIPSSQKGAANGVATLDASSRVPAAQLPSYVDGVLEYFTLAAMPRPGESGKIYIALNTNRQYRWPVEGSDYVELVASPGTTDAIVEGTVNRWWTNARTLASTLVGMVTNSYAVVTAADTVLTAFGKLQSQNVVSGWGVPGFKTPPANLNAMETGVNKAYTTDSATQNKPYKLGSTTVSFDAGGAGLKIGYADGTDEYHWSMLMFDRGTNAIAYRRMNSKVILPDDYLVLYPSGKTALDVSQGGTGGGTQATAQAGLGLVPVTSLTDVTPGRLVTPGWQGFGSTLGIPLPGGNANQILPSGIYWTNTSWTGSPYAGNDLRNRGQIFVLPWGDATYQTQSFSPLFSAANNPKLERAALGGVWRGWDPVIGGLSALSDPANDTGGLMSYMSTAVGEYWKHASGQLTCTGLITTGSFTANSTGNAVQAVYPHAFAAGSFPSVSGEARADISLDHYGVYGANQNASNAATNILLYIRNGGTAQTFKVWYTATGRWK